jgi:hypothetical protein
MSIVLSLALVMIPSVPSAAAKTLWGKYDPFRIKASNLNPEEFFEVSGYEAAIRPSFVKTNGSSDVQR